MGRVLVTGANRGLGYETARRLVAAGHHVLLGSRDAAAGELACAKLVAPSSGAAPGSVEAVQLDVAEPNSVAALTRKLSTEPPLDAVVNNGAVLREGFNAEIVRHTLEVNYHGIVRLTDALLPRLAASANVVMVSSGMGELAALGPELRARLSEPNLTRAELEALAREFVAKAALSKHERAGFTSGAYGGSKALLNAFTRVLSRELAATSLKINAVCPGWVRTRMGGDHAPRSIEQGAAGIVWAATLPSDGPRAGFFRDGRPIPW